MWTSMKRLSLAHIPTLLAQFRLRTAAPVHKEDAAGRCGASLKASDAVGGRRQQTLWAGWICAIAGAALALAACGQDGEKEYSAEAPDLPENTFVIENARVFDGEKVLAKADVVVENGLIVAVGPDVRGPKAAPRIDGAGKTLLPGLIDAHTHTFTPEMLASAARFGVTAELDMFTAVAFFETVRDQRDTLENTGQADMFSAATLATVPGGHGTQFGLPIPTLTAPDEAEAFVAERIEEGADYIKIAYEPASGGYPSLDLATMKALVDAAHARRKLAIVHMSNSTAARDAVDAGADGLAHGFGDAPVDAKLVEDMAARGVFIIPTLSVISGLGNADAGAELAKDAHLAPFTTAQQKQNMNASFGLAPEIARRFDLNTAMANAGRFHAGGVTVLAGSDSPNPGTAHGPSVHGEMSLLVAAGLTPLEALAAATSRTAEAFGLEAWRGRIVEGGRADFVLVEGDPTERIGDTRRIAAVWKNGYRIERPRLGEAENPASEAIQPELPQGIVSTFETDISSPLGGTWVATMDEIAGGSSRAMIGLAEEGAGRTPGALRVAGKVTTEFPFPWAGAGIFFDGNHRAGPFDLSGYGSLRFMGRGDARTYSVMLYTRTTANRPAIVPVTMRPMWLQYDLPLENFAGASLDEVYGIAVTAGRPEGTFTFEIDDVRLIPKRPAEN